MSQLAPPDLSSIQVVDAQGREIVRPDVLKAIAQFTQLGQMVRIRRSLERRHTEGKIDPRILNANQDIQWVDLRYPEKPWATAFFYNYGPNTVYISQDSQVWKEIRITQGLELNLTESDRRLELFCYRCNPGETAVIDAIGKY